LGVGEGHKWGVKKWEGNSSKYSALMWHSWKCHFASHMPTQSLTSLVYDSAVFLRPAENSALIDQKCLPVSLSALSRSLFWSSYIDLSIWWPTLGTSRFQILLYIWLVKLTYFFSFLMNFINIFLIIQNNEFHCDIFTHACKILLSYSLGFPLSTILLLPNLLLRPK
jgi:hypothetical protein